MSHIKGGEKLGEIALGRQDAGENLREVEDFHFKGGRIFSLIREERGTGLFETIIRDARENLRELEDFHFKGGRRFSLIREERGAGLFETIISRSQANDIKEGGRLDLCDIPLLTICKLHKHVICEINNECIINE